MKRIEVAGEKAIAEMQRLRSEFPDTGLWPILLGDDEELERIEDCLEDSSESPAEILSASNAIDANAWFVARTLEDPELYQCEEGDWPYVEPGEIGIVTHLDLSGSKPKKKVHIGLLPVIHSFESFAQLNWGGWNDCPFPKEHCAIHRYWKEKYGSEVVSVTGDIVQCFVANPPRDRAMAMALAREQYKYCYDIVDQGTGTIAALAASLLNAKTWYFWWD
ncbi:DUF4253 domain-containing protein [Pirellulaceae bacterium SH449]